MMKWITLFLIIAASPTYSQAKEAATKQYTEGACVLLAQEVLQYKRKFGKRSAVYQNTKAKSDKFCKNPVKKLPKKVLLQMEQDKKNKLMLEKLKQQESKNKSN